MSKWNYSSHAKSYDKRAEYSIIAISKLIKKIKLKKNSEILEIGAGTAKLSKILCKLNFNLTATEPNKEIIKFGKKNTNKFTNINWIKCSAEKLKLNKRFKVVFFGSSFNVINKKKFFKKCKNILDKNGHIVCMWNHRNLKDPQQKKN